MPKPLDWRTLESALRTAFHNLGYALDQPSDSGDIIAADALSPDGYANGLNLTTLAKAMAEEIEQ